MLVWNPTSKKYINTIESIQKRFLKYLYFVEYQYYPYYVSYADFLAKFGLESLEHMRGVALVTFLRDIVQGHTDDDLLQEICIQEC